MKAKKLLIGILAISPIVSAEVVTVPVISTTPTYTSEVIKLVPTRTCVQREVRVQNSNNGGMHILGTSIGALAGHVISRNMGGNDVTRILGTVAGGAIGNEIGNSNSNSGNTRIMNDCTVKENYSTREVITGYNVRYNIDGQTRSTIFSYDPGSTISVDVKKVYTVLR
jgi:uncharacterized protein YcfJ